jgi:hypothetical protein
MTQECARIVVEVQTCSLRLRGSFPRIAEFAVSDGHSTLDGAITRNLLLFSVDSGLVWWSNFNSKFRAEVVVFCLHSLLT